MRRRRVGLNGNRGQSMVEFALVLPIFCLLLLGITQFGLVFHQYHVMTGASREGARIAALGGTDAQIRSAVEIAAVSINKGVVTTTITPAIRVSGASVSVQVTSPVAIMTPRENNETNEPSVPWNLLPQTISGTTTMRVE